ncbi:MAG: Archaeal ATPase [Bacteroidetes bacterium ADurb.Bin408]|nr:MAG: Archaeal ATPase [Bacteroidetes bacterium ADurb.Bin408]
MSVLKNPFLLTGYIGEKYFCNRENEIEILEEHFDNERNVVLFSWRRLGKTALLKHFQNILQKKQKDTQSIYIDLLGATDMLSAIKQISQAVYEKFGRVSKKDNLSFQKLLGMLGMEMSFDPISGNPKIGMGLRTVIPAEKSLNEIGLFLRGMNKNILVILDEFQQVTQFPEKNGEAVFRGWVQSFPEIRFVFSGSHRQMMQSMFTSKSRPFYRSAQLLQLEPIPLNEYRNFIKKHFKEGKKTIDDAVIDEIYNWSRQQTYCVQLLCNMLYGRFDKIELKHLPNVYIDLIAQESAFFSAYTKLLTRMQWLVLKAVAMEEPLINPYAKEFISRHNLGAASTVNTSLKKLINSEIVVEDNSKYYVHDVALARWLQRV